MILRHSELNTHACSFVAPCGNAFEPYLSQLRRDWRGAVMMGLSPPGWLLPAPWHTNTLSVTGGTAMGKAALPEAKKIVFFSQTLSHRHFCFCVPVLTHMKKIICSDSTLASLTLLVIADEYLFLQRERGVVL